VLNTVTNARHSGKHKIVAFLYQNQNPVIHGQLDFPESYVSTPAQTLTFSLKKMRKKSLRPDEEEISINMTGRARKMRKRVIQSDEDDDINDTPSPSKHALVPIDSRQSGKSDLCHVSVSPKPGHWGRLEGIGYY
jgi:hypothetical protein